MKKRILLTALTIAIFILILTSSSVSAENFTSLDNEINETDHVNLDSDIVLNQNTTDEERTYENGILIKDREINIEGNNHAICAKDSNDNHAKVFNIINSNVTLSNMEICCAQFNGAGGTISLDENSSLILSNVTFRDNSAIGIYGEGGAIYSRGHLEVHDSKFEGNYASGAGGAIYSLSSESEIDSSKFISNIAKWYGGALFCNYIITADSCLFDQNNAYSGGAFHFTLTNATSTEAMIFNRTSFTRNTAIYGGAFSTSGISKIIATNSNFTSNHATKGGVLYKNGQSASYIQNCLIESNSAEFGAVICDDSYDGYYDNKITFDGIINTTLNDNSASRKSSIYYGREGNLFINQSIISNNANTPVFNGKGNITVLNSKISNFGDEFIVQLLYGNIIVLNNTWGADNANLDEIINCSNNSNLITEGDYYETMFFGDVGDLYPSELQASLNDLDCCSVVVRINQTDFTISHRRDGGVSNFTLFIDQDEDFIRQFKSIATNFCLSKVYANGWVIGAGGWDDSGDNEKVEAIASDMAKNENINMEALEMILEIKKKVGRGHMLIVAPNGTYGNVIFYEGDEVIKIGTLSDGGYIISPNGIDYRREGHLDNISDVVFANINLSANDGYGFERHCILVHHITLSENGFSDDIYVTNDDGERVNATEGVLCDNVWFKEKYLPSSEIPFATERTYVGSYHYLYKTIDSHDAIRGYNSDYNYSIQLFDHYGETLSNAEVNITVNGKTGQYTTDDNGTLTIPFAKLTTSQTIRVSNPVTGEVAENSINIVSRLIGSDVVMGYYDGTAYKVKIFDESGNPVGKNQVVTIKLNKKTYSVKTDSNGIATLNLPDTLIPNKYTLTATYAGQTIKNTINVKQTLKTKSKTIKKTSKKLVLTATLKTIKNKPVKNKKITFKFKGKKYTAKTNKKGIAKVIIKKKIIKKLKAGKKYAFRVSYLKNTIKSTVKVKR
jgi:predicted outer membrane repeat protein